MQHRSTWRFAGFASAIGLVALSVVLSGYGAWSKSRQLNERISAAPNHDL